MKILIVFTGGTIGSSLQGDFIRPNADSSKHILALYQEARKDETTPCEDIEFETCNPYTLLSENLTGSHVNQLVETLHEKLTDPSYDGILVTHGTDTIQYTAAALELTLKPHIPIVLVSSNYTLDDTRANGVTNFKTAVDFIMEKEAGIFVSYCNTGQRPIVHRGGDLLGHLAYDDSLYSLVPSCTKMAHGLCSLPIDTLLVDPSPILYCKAIPGISYPLVQPHTKAVLIETYHSGTLCTTGSTFSDYVFDLEKKNIPVYLTGIESRSAYESTEVFAQLPVQILEKCSPIYAYMLLWYLYSQT